jgi:hypothetical protein
MIPERYNDYYGDTTRWFVGRVVSIDDPKQLGRIQVRIYGIHSTNTLDIPDEDLPWAQVVVPINEGGTAGIGNNLGIQVYAQAFGIFLDGKNSQLPLVLGSIPKPEEESEGEISTNQLARGVNTLTKTADVSGAPTDPYAAEYPNNAVHATKSGHIIEIDDTDGAERIHVRHKSGSFIEFHPDGAIVIKGNGVYIDGGSALNIKANGTIQEYSNGTVEIGSGEITVSGITHTKHTHTDNPGLAGAETTGPHN